MKIRKYLSFAARLVTCSFIARMAVADEAAERIFYNAKIFTGELEHPYAEAVAIRNDKIVAVGSRAEDALCSNSKCECSIELHDRTNGHSTKTPTECPRCKSPMISTCPECGFLLMGNPAATDCAVCRADIRRVFARRRARVQSA
jgi:hypothetical protein